MSSTSTADAIGTAISDYYKHKKAGRLWVYSDLTDKDEIPVPYLFRDFNDMPDIEQKALNLCKGNILDVGAAAGAHTIWLQNKNKKVTALEISDAACMTMKVRGIKNVICEDFYKYIPSKKYDTLLFLMNGIGIAGSIHGLPTFFEQCKKLLNPNGEILLDSSDLIFLFDDEEDKPTDKYYGEVRYVMNYKKLISAPFNWLFIDFKTLKIEAKKHGFNCEKILDGEHFDYLARLTTE